MEAVGVEVVLVRASAGRARLAAVVVVAELLTAHAGLAHEATLGHREDRHALLVLRVGRGAGRGRDGARLRRERELALLEVCERLGVSKKMISEWPLPPSCRPTVTWVSEAWPTTFSPSKTTPLP
jgi:hypothetical protein